MLVVIGSNGFIGRHLTVEAARRGVPLTLVSPAFDRAFLEEFAPKATIVAAADFASPEYDRVLERASAVVYLASRSVPSSSAEHPGQELVENVEPAFSSFLRISTINPEVPIIYVSSGGTVYGRTDVDRIPETHPLQPISPYGLGKRLCEDCLRYCGDAHGQRFVILRVSNPVGRWHRSLRQGLVTAVIRAVRSDSPLQIFGDGKTVRDYLDADDLADAILRAAATEARSSVWNVGSGEGHSTLEIVDLVAQAAGRKPEIQFVTRRAIDVERCVLSIERITQDLGWSPKTPLLESTAKVVRQMADA